MDGLRQHPWKLDIIFGATEPDSYEEFFKWCDWARKRARAYNEFYANEKRKRENIENN